MDKIYLDYAASTPVDPRVFVAMRRYFSEKFGNPGSLHSFGQEAIAAVDASREGVARAIGADFREIIFTGSATEANNLALRGALRRFRICGLGPGDKNFLNPSGHTPIPQIIVSAIEHESVLETARDLERDGAEVIYLPVDRRGVVDLKKLQAALSERTVLVSVMYANNEIGTVQPLFEIHKIIEDFKKQNFQFLISSSQKTTTHHLPLTTYPLFHSDAAQALQFLDCDVKNLGVDLMTLSAHKIYGPKGVGALYVKSGSVVSPIISGGGQEFGLRSGTENVSAIVSFAEAVSILAEEKGAAARIERLRDYFWQGIKKICADARINGLAGNSGRLPNILNVYFQRHEAQFLLTKLDRAGVAASSGSACRSRSVESSYVIEALGYSKERAKRSARFSFGRPTRKSEIDRTMKIIQNII